MKASEAENYHNLSRAGHNKIEEMCIIDIDNLMSLRIDASKRAGFNAN